MKKGFTLIELLAVIVILAIIALIAVPIVLNIIDDSKESSLLRSAEFYLDAVEYTIADAFLYHGGLSDGTYPITSEGDICKIELDNEGNCPKTGDKSNTLKVEVNGDKPTGGYIIITNGNVTDVSIMLGEKVIINNSKGELIYQIIKETPEDYFEVGTTEDGLISIVRFKTKTIDSVYVTPRVIGGKKITAIGNGNGGNGNVDKGDNGFMQLNPIETLIISEGVTVIKEYAFTYQTIKKLILPSTIKVIEQRAFNTGVYMDVLELPDGLETIGSEAFYEHNINTIVIPSTVNDIGGGAFNKGYSSGEVTIVNKTGKEWNWCNILAISTDPGSTCGTFEIGTAISNGYNSSYTITYNIVGSL